MSRHILLIALGFASAASAEPLTAPIELGGAAPAAIDPQSLGCLTEAIAYESGREPVEGQQAVAQVILNRVRSPLYPKSVCDVIHQGAERRTGCQFTYNCDGSLRRRLPESLLAGARAVAAAALAGAIPDRVGAATNYHAYYVSPRWAPALARIGRIGAHIFYQVAGGATHFDPGAAVQIAAVAPKPAAGPVQPFSPWGLPLSAPATRE